MYFDCYTQENNLSSPIIQYTFSNVQWKVDGYNDANDFLDIYGVVATVKKTNEVMKPGYTKNITLSATLNNGTVISSNASLVITKSDI
jgi:hypothetical protein